jgi:hypothetical protein
LFILARLLTFFAHIAALELDLRLSLRTHNPKQLAEAVSSPTGFSSLWKPIKDAIRQSSSLDSEALGKLSTALKEALPESRSVLEEIRARLRQEPSDDNVLAWSTFSQLVKMAKHAGVVTDSDVEDFERINDFRNTFAHFRAEPFGRCEGLLRTIRTARRVLERRDASKPESG